MSKTFLLSLLKHTASSYSSLIVGILLLMIAISALLLSVGQHVLCKLVLCSSTSAEPVLVYLAVSIVQATSDVQMQPKLSSRGSNILRRHYRLHVRLGKPC